MCSYINQRLQISLSKYTTLFANTANDTNNYKFYEIDDA